MTLAEFLARHRAHADKLVSDRDVAMRAWRMACTDRECPTRAPAEFILKFEAVEAAIMKEPFGDHAVGEEIVYGGWKRPSLQV